MSITKYKSSMNSSVTESDGLTVKGILNVLNVLNS